MTGPVLRLRVFGSEKGPRHYVAVDDGRSAVLRAFLVDPLRFAGLSQGLTVTVTLTRTLRAVTAIDVLVPEDAEPSAADSARYEPVSE